LIILDISLPKMDGLRVLQKLREEKVMIPVLFLTVRAMNWTN
jgi:DNA-binding response OmpR family regulator